MYRNILIVKLSAIGDCLHALPVAHALKTANPDCRITWIVEKAAYGLLENNTYIDEVILFDKKEFKSAAGLLKHLPALSKQLKERHFDLAIDLQGLFKSAAISYISGAKQRLVYCNAREGSQLIGKRICGTHFNGHVVERYLDVARYLGCQINTPVFPINFTETEIAKVEAIVKHSGLNMQHSYVVLAPGANWPNKRWTMQKFSVLADQLYDKNLIPVLIGAASDETLGEEIVSKVKIPPVNLIGRTTLKQLAYVIRSAAAFVGGDTGPMHLAAAVGTPVVALFGPTDPMRNGPYSSRSTVIRAGHDCDGCWKRTCPLAIECLDAITTEQVWKALTPYVSYQ